MGNALQNNLQDNVHFVSLAFVVLRFNKSYAVPTRVKRQKIGQLDGAATMLWHKRNRFQNMLKLVMLSHPIKFVLRLRVVFMTTFKNEAHAFGIDRAAYPDVSQHPIHNDLETESVGGDCSS